MKKNALLFKQLILAILLFSIFIYVAIRGYYLSFTHDESLSFKIILGETVVASNNHLLNTFLMNICYQLFGNSEFSLRLPNILAFGLYAVFCYKILLKFSNFTVAFSGLCLLTFNPYLLDFFSLARGYGLSVGFALAGLYFFIQQNKYSPFNQHITNLSLALGFTLLSAFSSFVCLNLNISFFFILMTELYLALKNNAVKLSRKQILIIICVFLINLLVVFYIINKILILKQSHNLDFGGKEGFIENILTILIHRSIYFSYYGELFWKIIRQIIISFFVLTIIYQFFTKRYNSLTRVTMVLFLMIYGTVLQHYIFDAPYPPERSSLVFITLFALLILFFIEDVIKRLKPYLQYVMYFILLVAVSLPLSIHFINNLNLRSVADWRYDANTKCMMLEIKKYHDKVLPGKEISVSNEWIYEPAINFYRVIYSMKYIKPVLPGGIDKNSSFIYCSEDSLVSENNFEVLYHFKDTHTKLIRNIKSF